MLFLPQDEAKEVSKFHPLEQSLKGLGVTISLCIILDNSLISGTKEFCRISIPFVLNK